ncbi:MAG: YggS family pyridoxal phosphate-dependent enzyme [Saccharofermentanales bacterium]|nr:YggS family pyridoxal phosphate-dependent enzyme [Clostridiaceae bacterium]
MTNQDFSTNPDSFAVPHEQLQLGLETVRFRLAEAARQAGRRPEEITLIGVSKSFSPAVAAAANRLGLADLGENRVQELLKKIDYCHEKGLNPNWHLIGTLQRNKVRYILGKTHLIHSVDTLSLLSEISRRSHRAGCVTDLLLQVNVAQESSKRGFSVEELPRAAEEALRLPGIKLHGLMTMAPLFADPENTRPIFDQARRLFRQLCEQVGKDNPLTVLSMGMSADFLQAVACGATHVRIGTAIFGQRL